MTGRRVIALLVALPLACAAPERAPEHTPASAPALVRVERAGPAMGTRFRVVVYAPDEARGAAAAEAALARIAEVEACLTDWDPQSPVRRLDGRAELAQALPDDLFAVLATADRAVALSAGAFDPTVGPLTRLWRRALRQGQRPDPVALARAQAGVGWQGVTLDRERRTLTFARSGMALDLGGIGKGFALDRGLEVLRAAGLERALIDGGGDVAVGAPPPGEEGWAVAVRPFGPDAEGSPGPLERLVLRDAAVATSGERYGSADVEGRLQTHLVDPRTGDARARRLAATVVARDAALADALATGLCVSGADGLAGLRERLASGEGSDAGVLEAWVFGPEPGQRAALFPAEPSADG